MIATIDRAVHLQRSHEPPRFVHSRLRQSTSYRQRSLAADTWPGSSCRKAPKSAQRDRRSAAGGRFLWPHIIPRDLLAPDRQSAAAGWAVPRRQAKRAHSAKSTSEACAAGQIHSWSLLLRMSVSISCKESQIPNSSYGKVSWEQSTSRE